MKTFRNRFVAVTCILWLLSGAVAKAASGAHPPQAPKRSDVEGVLAASPGKGLPPTSPEPLSVIFVYEQKDHWENEHDYPRWQSRWALLLGGSSASTEKAVNLYGPDVDDPEARKGAPNTQVVSVRQWPTPAQWESANLIVIFTYITWSPERIDQVRQFLNRGGGLVLIHSGAWSADKLAPELAPVVGVGKFQYFREGPLKVEVTPKNHPICAALPANLIWEDEIYWPPAPLGDSSHLEWIASTREKTSPDKTEMATQPLFWTYNQGKGRVFGCVPGHYTWTFDDPYFRLVLLRGMAWASNENPYRFDHLALRGARCAAP